MKRKRLSEINAGSMADIAFLLLIFFLVTTTLEVDMGLFKKLPPKEKISQAITIKDKNMLAISINKNNEILIGDKIVAVNELQPFILEFIDNGGGTNSKGEKCYWCNGEQKTTLSDHPSKALITIDADRNASYETYVMVTNKIYASYTLLRNRVAYEKYGENYEVMEAYFNKYKDDRTFKRMEAVRKMYPLLLADVDPSNVMAKK